MPQRAKTQHQNKPKQLFLIHSSGSMLVFFTLGVMLLLSLLSGCGAGPSASAFPTARPTKTWTPLATLTPLATYTPSVTPLPLSMEATPADMPTRAPPPTIPAIGADVLAQLNNARRKVHLQVPNVQAPNVQASNVQAPNEVAIGGYEGEETECCNWPVNGRITSNVTANHVALDIATTLGTPVLAADEGRVVAAGWDDSGYGYRVIVNHGQGLQTLYAHLSNYPVEVGDDVNQGQMIGKIGSTGRSTGPHLHFEVRYYGRRIDPWDLLP